MAQVITAMAGRASLVGTCDFDFQPVSPTTLPGQACDGLGTRVPKEDIGGFHGILFMHCRTGERLNLGSVGE